MKNLLILSLLLFSFSKLSAQQEWAPIGTKWHNNLVYFYSQYVTGVNIYESVGDTLIDGHNCRIITRQDDACIGFGNVVYMYSDSNQVFFQNPNNDEFTLLYDFNTQAGESWDYTHVVETDTIVYNGFPLKRMMVYYGDSTQFTQFDTIIEKFGSIQRMFQYEVPICDETYNTDLRCYEDPDLGLVSLVSYACDFTPTQEIEKSNIEIFPTLFTNTISIDYKYDFTIKVFSITGQNHFQQNHSEGKNEINLSHLENGIYFIQLFDNKGHPLIVKKLVKIE